VLATSAPEDELETLRGVLDVDDHLTDVTSSEDVATAKPDPGIVAVALGRAGTAADDAVFVGDTIWDVEAAGRAGVATIGVRSGGVSEEELLGAGAVEVYADVRDLLEHLEDSRAIGL
jgi:phosphoglycolate phosphatase-like HAD superfamily hydrolase